MSEERTRRLSAIMFTDMVGYTPLMQEDELSATTVRDRHRTVLREGIEVHQGEIVQFNGGWVFADGLIAITILWVGAFVVVSLSAGVGPPFLTTALSYLDLPPRVVPHPMLVPAPVEGREGRASSGTRATA